MTELIIPRLKLGAASSAPTLGMIMRALKSISAIAVNRLLDRTGQPLWQRNYFERVIRDDDELRRLRDYVAGNPGRWAKDEENPGSMENQGQAQDLPLRKQKPSISEGHPLVGALVTSRTRS